VPDHTSCKEIFDGYGKLIPNEHVDVDMNFARELPCPSPRGLTDILNELYENRDELDRVANACYKRATQKKFDWDTVASQFDEIFQGCLQEPNEETLEEVIALTKKKKRKAPKDAALSMA